MNTHGFCIILKLYELNIILTFQRWEHWGPRKRFSDFLKLYFVRVTPSPTQSHCLLLKRSSYSVTRNFPCALFFLSVYRLLPFALFFCSNLDISQSFSFQPHSLENTVFCFTCREKWDPGIFPFLWLQCAARELEPSPILALWGVHEKHYHCSLTALGLSASFISVICSTSVPLIQHE